MKTETLIITGTLLVITGVMIYAIRNNYNVQLKALRLEVNLTR